MQLIFQVQMGLANQEPVLCSLRLGFGKETQADLGCRKVEPGGVGEMFRTMVRTVLSTLASRIAQSEFHSWLWIWFQLPVNVH